MSFADDGVDPMPEEPRLTEIPTSWTTIRVAHTSGPERDKAMGELIGRYHDAVGRYLKLKLRDPHLVDEVSQEFWTKLLTHKLAGADPSKGRFRDYLRMVLHRLIIDHFRSRKVQQLPPGDLLDPTTPDHDFDHVWRESVIKRVKSRLETFEVHSPNHRYSAVLNLRMANPGASIEELARLLNDQCGFCVSTEAYRKILQRARAKFLELLVLELRETIHPCEPHDIEAEINDLGLGSLYRKYSQDGKN